MKRVVVLLLVFFVIVMPVFCGANDEKKSSSQTQKNQSAELNTKKSEESKSPVTEQNVNNNVIISSGNSAEDKKSLPVSPATSASPAVSAVSPAVNSDLGKPAAIVNLTKAVTIPESVVLENLDYFKQNNIDTTREEVLESLIVDELLMQSIDKAGYSSYIQQVADAYKEEHRKAVEQAYGKMSDEQYEQACVQSYGGSSDEVATSYAGNYVLQNIIMNQYADMFEKAKQPSDAEIEEFYSSNKTSFTSPDYLHLAHIFFEFGSDKNASLAKAASLASKIKKGNITFESAVKTNSEDKDSKDNAGDIGYYSRDDETSTAAMGDTFTREVFKLDDGDVSGVIESNIGYHIVKVIKRYDAKILSLDDKITPDDDSMTLREYITQGLLEEEYEKIYEEAYVKYVEDIRSQASIRII